MNRDYFAFLADMLSGAVAAAERETHPGRMLPDLTQEQARRVAAVLADDMSATLACKHTSFDAADWLAECGLQDEVRAVRAERLPVERDREFWEPLAFNDVRVGDWIRYIRSPGYPIVGRVWSVTDDFVYTERARFLHADASRPSAKPLQRATWEKLLVELVDPAEVDPDQSGKAERRVRLPRTEAARIAMEAARSYLRQHGHLRVPAKHVQDGYRLGGWIHDRRYDYRRGAINPERVRDLDALHVSWRDGCEPDARR